MSEKPSEAAKLIADALSWDAGGKPYLRLDVIDNHLDAARREGMAALVAERDETVARVKALEEALRCEEAYSHARTSNEWMATLTDAGWDGKSNPRPFINKLRRVALGGGE